jgi:DNA mismatch repair protein MSH5
MSFLVPGDEHFSNKLQAGLSRRQGNMLQISALIDVESRLSVSCSNAVLSYLQRRKGSNIPDSTDMFKVSFLQSFTLEGTM